jgi:hypothetical protein
VQINGNLSLNRQNPVGTVHGVTNTNGASAVDVVCAQNCVLAKGDEADFASELL